MREGRRLGASMRSARGLQVARSVLVVGGLAALGFPGRVSAQSLLGVGPPPVAPSRLTAAEASGWTRTTNHFEVLDFLGMLGGRTDRVAVRRLALTDEGRTVPVVFVGAPPTDDPEAERASGKPTILILGSIHGDEPAGREGSLALLRSFVLGADSVLLDRVNLIVVPYLNPDGGEAGRRENSLGYDLNRDWVVAETPEVGAVLDRLVNRFRPEVFVDAHNGGAYPYHLTYQATLDPSADPDLVALARGAMYEHVRSHLAGLGMSVYWYSGPTFEQGSGTWYWRTTEPWPRKQHSYGGLRNMITLLFEVPTGHSLEVEARAAFEGLRALATFVAERGREVEAVVREANRRSVEEPPSEVHIAIGPTAHPGAAEFLVTTGPGTRETPALVTGENRTLYVPTATRPAPWGYAIDPELGDLVALLRRHDVRILRLDEGTRLDVERYRLTEVTRGTEEYQGHLLLDVVVGLEAEGRTFAAGTYLVPLAQEAGRLVPQLLEPDAVDSAVRWNLLDDWIDTAVGVERPFPIHRVLGAPVASTTALP